MSYEPGREAESMFITAWSAVDVAVPTILGSTSNPNYTFNIDTQGIGDRVTLASDVLTTPDNLQAFWIGDVRSQTLGTSSADQNYYSIAFANSNATLSAPIQEQRRSMNGDLTYSLYDSAELTMYYALKSNGQALARYVRVLGMMIGD